MGLSGGVCLWACGDLGAQVPVVVAVIINYWSRSLSEDFNREGFEFDGVETLNGDCRWL